MGTRDTGFARESDNVFGGANYHLAIIDLWDGKDFFDRAGGQFGNSAGGDLDFDYRVGWFGAGAGVAVSGERGFLASLVGADLYDEGGGMVCNLPLGLLGASAELVVGFGIGVFNTLIVDAGGL